MNNYDSSERTDRDSDDGMRHHFVSDGGIEAESDPAADGMHPAAAGASERCASGSKTETCDELPKPIIKLEPGTLQECIKQAEACLAQTGRYFERSGAVVAVTIDSLTHQATVRDVNKSDVERDLDTLIDWYKLTATGKSVRSHPPSKICDAILKGRDHAELPALKGVAHQPFLRQDGSVCMDTGYDPAMAILAGFQTAAFEMPAYPTRADAEAALGLLDALLEEFPFASEGDRSAALCAMLTAVARPSISAAPLFHIRAHQAGTGKSFLCRIITAFATATAATPMPFPSSETECAKLLLSVLKDGPAVIELDNLTTDLLAHGSLCAVLTADGYKGRKLGNTQMSTVTSRALFLSSGNNVGPIGDMARRSLTINLDADCDMPATRTFKNPDLLANLKRERGVYVAAALTVIKAWLDAYQPLPKCPDIGSFEEWSLYCRQAVIWLGKPDPAASMFVGMKEDPERDLLGRLLSTLALEFKAGPIMVKAVIKRAQDIANPNAEALMDVLLEITGDNQRPNAKRLGHWIKRHAGHVVDGLKLVKSPTTRNAAVWNVVTV